MPIINTQTKQDSPIDRRPSTDKALQIGKIHPLIKITVTLEPLMQFGCPPIFRISKKNGLLSVL